MAFSRLLCELEIDHVIDDYLRDVCGITLRADRELLEDLRALEGETFVETAERVLGIAI